MAGMVSSKVFAISLVCLVATTCGLIGLLFISFNYQGPNELAWIYDVAGACVVLWIGSAAVAVTNVVVMARKTFSASGHPSSRNCNHLGLANLFIALANYR